MAPEVIGDRYGFEQVCGNARDGLAVSMGSGDGCETHADPEEWFGQLLLASDIDSPMEVSREIYRASLEEGQLGVDDSEANLSRDSTHTAN